MSQISSINFKPSNEIQTRHNDRDLPPKYLIGGVCECNHTHQEALKLRNKMIDEAKEKYSERTGQKFQGQKYEWSAVVNLKPNSTMQDLEALAKHFNEKYGFQCYQIAIHRDEGHFNEQGEKIINHHAHLEFIMLDKNKGITTFKKGKFGVKKMREIQTETAQILGMQRGIDKRLSGVERIEPRKYAQMKEAEKTKIKEIKAENLELKKEINKQETKNENLKLEKDLALQYAEKVRKHFKNKGFTKAFYDDINAIKRKIKENKDGIILKNIKKELYETIKKYQKDYKTHLNANKRILSNENQKKDTYPSQEEENAIAFKFDPLNKELKKYLNQYSSFKNPNDANYQHLKRERMPGTLVDQILRDKCENYIKTSKNLANMGLNDFKTSDMLRLENTAKIFLENTANKIITSFMSIYENLKNKYLELSPKKSQEKTIRQEKGFSLGI